MTRDSADHTEPARSDSNPWRTILLLLPILILVAASYFFRHTDPDYWWHVRTGQLIVESGALPRTDSFSYTAAGQPWVIHEWLTQLGFYLIQHSLGYWANAALFGLLGTLTLLAVYAISRLRGLGEVGATLFSLLALLVGAASANIRPQMITALFLAIAALILTKARVRGNPSLHVAASASKQPHSSSMPAAGNPKQTVPVGLWLLPLLMVLWANLHGGYVIGLVLIWLTVAGEGFAGRSGRPAIPFKPLLLVALLAAAATLVSPNGLSTITYPFTYAGTGNASMRFIREWQSPDFHVPFIWVFAAILLLSTVVGFGGSPLGLSEILWALVFGFLALTSLRHVPLYGIIVVPLIGTRLANWLPVLRRPIARWRRITPLFAFWLLLPLVLIWVLLGVRQGNLDLQIAREPSSATYPAGGVAFLSTSDLKGNLFNEYGWGGYLIYHLYPQRLVFIDGRADVYGDEHVEDYFEVAWVQPGWHGVLDQHQVALALVRKDSSQAVLLESSGEWDQLFVGPVEVLFARRDLD